MGRDRSVAEKIGCMAETLRSWIRKAERDNGRRAGPTSDEKARMKGLERENRELRRANEILRKASLFRTGGARPPTAPMVTFIDDHREEYGTSGSAPFCRLLRLPTTLQIPSF